VSVYTTLEFFLNLSFSLELFDEIRIPLRIPVCIYITVGWRLSRVITYILPLNENDSYNIKVCYAVAIAMNPEKKYVNTLHYDMTKRRPQMIK